MNGNAESLETTGGVMAVVPGERAVEEVFYAGGVDDDDAREFIESAAQALASADLPSSVATAIRDAETLENIDFVGAINLQDQITKARTIRVGNGAAITIGRFTLPWYAVVADELVIESPSSKAVISRPSDAYFWGLLKGADGADGSDGISGSGTNQHAHGNPGQNGGHGAQGEDGRTQSLPRLYIMANRVRWGTTESQPPKPAILVMYDGIPGGRGGRGGDGGNGGNGAPGADGDSDAFNCRRGPANGGDGGLAGQAARGGHGARGGDGGNVVLVSPTDLIADFILVRQEGGDRGEPGASGAQGRGGRGGDGGRPRGWCQGRGRRGRDRPFGGLVTGADGGEPGRRGMKVYVQRSIDDLL